MDDATRTRPATEMPSEPVERFEPELLQGELVEAEHLVRYLWASGIARDREVLDAGCGAGYGCAIMVETGGASRCVGLDLSEDAVSGARKAYAGDQRLDFCVGDVVALPFDDGAFDLVTCFETIEHVREQELVARELARVLRPGGLLLISSPNLGVYPPGNHYHERELSADEFEALLLTAFAEVQLLRQHNWLASAVLDDEQFRHDVATTRLEIDAGKVQGREPGQELYTLAVCGDRPVDLPRQRALLTHGLEVRRWIDEIERRGEQIARHEETILGLGDELARTREALAAAEQRLLDLRGQHSTTMAQLERQTSWLDRAEIDLDAWMRRRIMRRAFEALRLVLRVRRRFGGRRRR